ncbi:WD40-like Beta Propeller Repeat [Marivirga sericea]|uniref:WD40-like Beta Propeller Repeat n=1 Tax=Marivirga sericea TaxID=1028 RepID=A0A1X7LAF2_9BACT|nr:OmpA family protein [Marivirga sericea]SMG50828.1 WD40-like Beta Propeller Repeat [Marivirga sericea]
MKKLYLALLTLLFVHFSQAQETMWADRVIEFSSELEETQYSVKQLLGKPNVYPWGDGSPSAWTPNRPGREEFVKVGFDNPKPIRQIAIAESYNPSALTKIYFYDEAGNEYLMIEREPVIVNQPGRFLRLFTELTEFNVAAVKLEFDGGAVPGYYSIDAVGITDSETPIDLQLELVPNVKKELVSERLDERVNSPYEELKPILSPDGKQLFFGRKFHPDNVGGIEDYEDIWVSDLDTINNEWQEAINIGAPLNSDGPNWVSSITPDGNTLVLLIGNEYDEKRNKMFSGVSVSSKEGKSWSKPENLEIDDFYNMSEKANFYLANSRKTMIMSVKRDDSFGDRDLYVSFEKRDGTWTAPMNLGEIVNTATDETSPFLAADDKTLFFSSSGYIGFGKSDIYMTQRLDDTWQNWSEPYNMGPQVNSAGDDLFFSMPAEGNYAYYTKEDSVGDMDIFRLAMPLFNELNPVITISGRVVDAETQEPLDAIVSYETLDGTEVGKVQTDPTTGEYKIALPAGKEYQYIAKVKGYLPISENVDLTNQKESRSFNNDMILVPVKEKAEIVLNNVFFAFDSYELLASSKSELDRMVDVMNDNGQIEVVIIGHTDSTGPEEYNQQLSEKRAQSVVNYLTGNGIDRDRLEYLGKGESEPAYSNDTKENRAKNRRVNFKVDRD